MMYMYSVVCTGHVIGCHCTGMGSRLADVSKAASRDGILKEKAFLLVPLDRAYPTLSTYVEGR